MPYKDDAKRKAKQREYSKKWYASNRKKHQAGVARNKRDARTRWMEYKAQQVCAHCGAQHPAIIDFHHVIRDSTKRSVNRLVSDGKFTKAREEAEGKCIPLCANCHRVLHYNEVEVKKAERKVIRKRKKAKKKKMLTHP